MVDVDETTINNEVRGSQRAKIQVREERPGLLLKPLEEEFERLTGSSGMRSRWGFGQVFSTQDRTQVSSDFLYIVPGS